MYLATGTQTVSLVPSEKDPNPLCYECPNATYAEFVHENDPLCVAHFEANGTCDSFGYTRSVGNDPVFTDAALYNKIKRIGSRLTVAAAVGGDWNSTCAGDAMAPLLYGVDDYTAQSVGLPLNPPADESLANAICCDPVYAGYPEPKGLFAQPDVALFRKVDATGVTTFYDSVCGIPLFRAPMGRSFAEWEEDTRDHGWPSFRAAEVVEGNVLFAPDGVTVVSACGTKLGTNEPDDAGDRWCMDLVCISGSNTTA